MEEKDLNKESFGVADQIIVALRRIIRAVDLRSRYLSIRFGLTVPQLLLLNKLDVLDGATVKQLTKEVHLSQATVTGILDRLENRGLVRRVRSGKDRRCVEIHLNPAGREILKSAPRLLQDSFLDCLAKLEDWEQTQILSSLQHIVAMLEAKDVEAVPIISTGPIDARTDDSEQKPAVSESGQTISERRPHSADPFN